VYLHLSGEVTDALWRGGYSVLAVAHHLGFGRGVGAGLEFMLSAAVGASIVRAGFFRRDERVAMILAVLLMLVASPLVWSHYFVLLMIPLALAKPRFGPVWLVPVAMWVCPPSTTVVGWQVAVAWAAAGWCFVAAIRASREGGGQRTAATTPVPMVELGAMS
jgi:hypothetical protein